MGTEHYCLRWNNHQSNLLGVFSQLLRDESLVDVTLSCSEGHSIRAHKVVLSACSSYFQSLFIDHPSRHPIVILKDVHFSELRTLIEFMYKGEVNVEYRQLSTLLKTAESLKVKGLTEMTALSNLYNEDSHGHGHEHEPMSMPMPMDHTTTIIPTIKMEQSVVENNQSITESASILPLITPLVRYSESSDRPPSSIEGSVKSFDCSRPESPEKLSQTTIPLINVNTTTTNSDENRNENFLHGNNAHKQCNASVNDHGHHQNDQIVDEEDDDDDEDDYDDDYDTTRTPMNTTTTSTTTMSSNVTNSSTDRMLLNQPVAGPSGLAPIQNVPLSLKKENNWSSSSHSEEKPNNLSGIRTPTNQLSDTDLSPSQKTDYMETMSTLSSGSSTPVFTLYPFPNVSNSIFEETSSRLLNILHPNMFTGSSVSLSRTNKSDLSSMMTSANSIKCNICSAAFPSAWLLEQHMALQHGNLNSLSNDNNTNNSSAEEKPFICDQCGQSYRYRSAYMKHREQNHRARLPADKLFTCDVCGMQFRYLKSFKKHRLNHTFERIHGRTMLYMNYHEKQSNSGSPNLCNNMLSTNHQQILHETYNITDNCNDQVSSSNEAVVEENGAENDSEFSNESKAVLNYERQPLNMVEVKCEQKTPPPYLNSILDKCQMPPLSLLQHQQLQQQKQQSQSQPQPQQSHPKTLRDKRFICPFCGKCVRSKENLKLHVRKHTGEKPFVCFFCARAFGGKSDLTRHLRIHTGERPYHCEMCGKSFARADYLSKHLTTHVNKDDDFKKNFEFNSVVGGKF